MRIDFLIFFLLQEKWSFDDPENRRESIIKHAKALFRGARNKLKSKHFNDKKLKTKEDRIKNKPSHLNKNEWKFLVDYWSDDKVMVRYTIIICLFSYI